MNDNDVLGQDEESEINLTPMLDVVFIMLIFFIVTAVFVKEPGREVTKPEAATAMTPRAATIFVAITAGNEVWIDGQKVETVAIRGEIERIRSENPEGGLVIQADRDAENRTLMQVMDAAREARVADVTIATER